MFLQLTHAAGDPGHEKAGCHPAPASIHLQLHVSADGRERIAFSHRLPGEPTRVFLQLTHAAGTASIHLLLRSYSQSAVNAECYGFLLIGEKHAAISFF